MGALGATLSIGVSAALGFGLRLLLYPQFVLGAAMFAGSILLKLSRNPAGVAVVVLGSAVAALVLFLLNDKIIKAIKKVAPAVGKQAKIASEFTATNLNKGVAATPAYVFTTIGFLLPALGQFLGSMATIRMLSSLDVAPKNLPGAGYTATFSLMYLLTLTTGLSKKWASPSKVSFLLQSMMVLRALATTSAKDLRFNEHLPSVLAGWGSLLLSMTPGSAIVAAAKAGAASAALAGAGVASFEGIKALAGLGGKAKKGKRKSKGQELEDTEPESENKLGKKSFEKAMQDWSKSFDEQALRTWATENLNKQALTELFAKTFAKKPGQGKKKNKTLEKEQDKGEEEEEEEEEEEQQGDQEKQEETNVIEKNDEQEESQDVVHERQELTEKIEESGVDVNVLSPPIHIAFPLVLFRALPTCLTIGVALVLGISSLIRGQFKPGTLAVPVILAPFALGEVVNLVHQVGFRFLLTGGAFNPANRKEFAEKYQDGMSLLLWQSPTMLKAWRSVSSISSPEALLDDLSKAPAQWINPDEDVIESTPELSLWILGQLGASIVIDIIGASSYAIPALGEMTDFIWAPTQAFLIQRMYAMPGISALGFLEELLPFTDALPTAVIGWFYAYGEYLPVWGIRVYRKVQRKEKKSKRKSKAH